MPGMFVPPWLCSFLVSKLEVSLIEGLKCQFYSRLVSFPCCTIQLRQWNAWSKGQAPKVTFQSVFAVPAKFPFNVWSRRSWTDSQNNTEVKRSCSFKWHCVIIGLCCLLGLKCLDWRTHKHFMKSESMRIKEISLRQDPDLRKELALLARGCDFVLPSRFKKRLKAFQQVQVCLPLSFWLYCLVWNFWRGEVVVLFAWKPARCAFLPCCLNSEIFGKPEWLLLD